MVVALKDSNSVATRLAVLNTDSSQGTNLVRIAESPTTYGIKVNTSATISFTMVPIDPRDENYEGVWLFEGTDNKTYPAVATSLGELLINKI